jgi:hypothetical protein
MTEVTPLVPVTHRVTWIAVEASQKTHGIVKGSEN